MGKSTIFNKASTPTSDPGANAISGQNHEIAGVCNVVSGTSHQVTGNANAVSGDQNTCIGSNNHVEGNLHDLQASGSHCEGSSHSSNGFNSVHLEGSNAVAYNHHQHVRGGGLFPDGEPGCCQVTRLIAKAITPSQAPVDLKGVDGSHILLAPFKMCAFFIRILASSGDYGVVYHATAAGLVKRTDAPATTSLVGDPVYTIIADTTADNILVEVTADTVNGALKLTASGLLNTPIHWIATIEMVETTAF